MNTYTYISYIKQQQTANEFETVKVNCILYPYKCISNLVRFNTPDFCVNYLMYMTHCLGFFNRFIRKTEGCYF